METLHPLEFNYQEQRLLRNVVREIEQVNKQYPGVVPHNVMNAYEKVRKLYANQFHNEEYEMTTNWPDPSLDDRYE